MNITPTTGFNADGKHFATREAAEAYLAQKDLETARREAETALDKYNLALAKTAVTADGKPLKMFIDGWPTLYYLRPGYFNMPSLLELRVSLSNRPEYDSERNQLSVIEYGGRGGSTQERRVTYELRNLFYDEAAAEKELLRQQREWLEARAVEVRDLARKVEGAEVTE